MNKSWYFKSHKNLIVYIEIWKDILNHMNWYSWSYLTFLKVTNHMLKLLKSLKNASLQKLSLLGLSRNINKHECW